MRPRSSILFCSQERRLVKRWRPPLNVRVALWPAGTLLALLGAAVLASRLWLRLSGPVERPALDLALFGLGLGALALLAAAVPPALKATRLLTLYYTIDRDAATAIWRGG